MAKKKASLTAIQQDPMEAMKKARKTKSEDDIGKQQKEELKGVNTRLPADLVRRIKYYCVEHDMAIREFIQAAAEEKLSS